MAAATQTQLMLRVEPAELAARLRAYLSDDEKGGSEEEEEPRIEVTPEKGAASVDRGAQPTTTEPADGTSFTSLRMRFSFDGTTYPARLVNLPSLVETHRTHDDGATLYKCGDVAQMVVVYADEASRRNDERRAPRGPSDVAASSSAAQGAAASSDVIIYPEDWRSAYPDGLTAPLRDAINRRFARARRRRARVSADPQELAAVEQVMLDLCRLDEPFADELLSEDVVPFEDWMVAPDAPLGVSIADDAPLATKHPWVLAPNPRLHDEHAGFWRAAAVGQKRSRDRVGAGQSAADAIAVSGDDDGSDARPTGDPGSGDDAAGPSAASSSGRHGAPGTPEGASAEAARRRSAFAERQKVCAAELKVTTSELEKLERAEGKDDLAPEQRARNAAEKTRLQNKKVQLGLELRQMDEKMLELEIERATLEGR